MVYALSQEGKNEAFIPSIHKYDTLASEKTTKRFRLQVWDKSANYLFPCEKIKFGNIFKILHNFPLFFIILGQLDGYLKIELG